MGVVTYPGSKNELLSPDDLAAIDKAVGWPQADIAQAVAIEENQSEGGNTAAYNPTDPDGGSIGEFQLNGVHGPGGYLTPAFAHQMSDPVANSAEALSLFQGQGWAPWTGDPSLSPPYASMPTGQQAAQAVAGYDQATLDAQITSTSKPTASNSGGGGIPWWGILAPGAFALIHPKQTTGAVASTLFGGSVLKVVLEGVAALAGLGLIGLGLYKAADPQGSPAKTLEHGAEAAAV